MSGIRYQLLVARAAAALTRAGIAHRCSTGLVHIAPKPTSLYEAGSVVCKRMFTPATTVHRPNECDWWVPYAQSAAHAVDVAGQHVAPQFDLERRRDKVFVSSDILVEQLAAYINPNATPSTYFGLTLSRLQRATQHRPLGLNLDVFGVGPDGNDAPHDTTKANGPSAEEVGAVEAARRDLLLLLLTDPPRTPHPIGTRTCPPRCDRPAFRPNVDCFGSGRCQQRGCGPPKTQSSRRPRTPPPPMRHPVLLPRSKLPRRQNSRCQ